MLPLDFFFVFTRNQMALFKEVSVTSVNHEQGNNSSGQLFSAAFPPRPTKQEKII